jgi:hypothetical protein
MPGGSDWLKFKPVILAYFLAGDDTLNSVMPRNGQK